MLNDSSEQPELISIICRTMGRIELREAIKSVEAQTYLNIELVVVDAKGNGLGDEELLDSQNIGLKIVSNGKRLGRSEAANSGLDVAQGKYILFLDEDDWIAPDHLSTLYAALMKERAYKAAYSSVQKTDPEGEPLDYTFNESYSSLLLMRDNYIPIHAMLFAQSLLAEGCRFDERLDVYEDWDFWIQLSKKTEFLHVDVVTAFYREGGFSGTADIDARSRFDPRHPLGVARSYIFSKWLPTWSGEQLNALMGELDESERLSELNKAVAEEHEANLYHQNQLKERLILIKDLHQQIADANVARENLSNELIQSKQVIESLEDSVNQLRNTVDHLQASLEESQNRLRYSQNHLVELQQHAKQLERAHRLIEDSLFWRMTAPLRGMRDLLRKLFGLSEAFHEVDDVRDPESEVSNSESNDSHKVKIGEFNGEDYKAVHKSKAKTNLEEFLSSNEKLVFEKEADPQISIILVLFNQAPLTLLCLQSLLKNSDVGIQLLIIDNCSSDRTTELLDRIDGAEIIRNQENIGFLKAVNQGAELASCPYLLLLNNDATIGQKALSNALLRIESCAEIGAVGAKIKLLDGSLQEAGSIIWSDGRCLGYGRGDLPEAAAYQFSRDVDYCSGAFLLIRTEQFLQMGGFDEDFAPAYYEESDYCVRLKKAGYRVVYEPQSEIIHYEFASSNGYQGASKLQIQNREKFIEKHAEFLAGQFENDPKNILMARNSNRYPNILVLDDRVPYPSLGSGYPRCAHLLAELARLKLNVTFLPMNFPFEDWDECYQCVPRNIEVMLEVGVTGLREFLSQRQGFYDSILISRDHNMAAFNQIASEHPELVANCRIIYDAEAVSTPREIMRRRLFGEKISEQDEAIAVKKELALASQAAHILAVSDREAGYFRQSGYKNVGIVGHRLEIASSPVGYLKRNGLLFVGALRDEGSPNVDSLMWFVTNVLPIIERSIPDIELTVVGDNSAPSLAKIKSKNINFTGRLESIDSYYDDCKVFIAPTRFAAGIPHKIHEAASKGIPCVATQLLATQLGWSDEKQLLVADRAELFAEQCLRLIKDAELWQSIQENAMSAVRTECSKEAFRAAIVRALGMTD